MTIFSTIGLTYIIDKNNVDYIKALIKYGRNIFINKVNGEKITSGHSSKTLAADLQAIINASSDDNQPIVLQCETTDSFSAEGILPKIPTDVLLKSVPQTLSNNDLRIIHHSVSIIGIYLTQVTDPNRNDDADPLPTHIDILDINYKQAVHIFDQLQKMLDGSPTLMKKPRNITGCIHIAEANTILFQIDGVAFTLQYGENSTYGRCFPFYFHAGIGFGPNNALLHTPNDHPILQGLQKHFLAWKEKHYQGEMITPEQAGFIQQSKIKEIFSFWKKKAKEHDHYHKLAFVAKNNHT